VDTLDDSLTPTAADTGSDTTASENAAAPTSAGVHRARRRWSRRRRLIVIGSVCGLLVAGLDGWIIWQSQINRIPAIIVAEIPVAATAPGPSAPPSTRPATDTTTAPATTAPATTPPPAGALVDAGWVATVAARTGIPARAVTAYADAQLAMAATEPGCHVDWTMLAGIGAVESGHGRSHGSTLRPDGVTTLRILGPALDGTHGNIALAATPYGIQIDGDPRWDHAVGPMQFIPSTWAHWGTSATGGIPDPNDIDDAALTAARYLCAAGGDLSTATGWRAAVGAYNRPIAYAIKVTNLANTYAREANP
jgi:membrane-bound lytic murein transglycosylase B